MGRQPSRDTRLGYRPAIDAEVEMIDRQTVAGTDTDVKYPPADRHLY